MPDASKININGLLISLKDAFARSEINRVLGLIPTKTSQLENDSGFITSADFPVTSVNGKTGAVSLDYEDVNAMPANYIAPVASVNSKTGVVVLSAEDVGALPNDYTPPTEIFWVTYQSTTNAEIEAAINANKLPMVWRQTGLYVLSERVSATQHWFTGISHSNERISLECLNDTWMVNTATYPAVNNAAFTASPTAPTPATSDESTKLATTKYVANKIDDELANYSFPTEIYWVTYGTTTNAQIEAAITAGKLVACYYSGRTYTLTNRSSATNHYLSCINGSSNYRYQIRCNSDVWTNTSSQLAPLSSPAFSGNPTATTQAVGNNSTRLATTAFVQNAINNSVTSDGTVSDVRTGTTVRSVRITINGKLVTISIILNTTTAVTADLTDLFVVSNAPGPNQSVYGVGRSLGTSGSIFGVAIAAYSGGIKIKSFGTIPVGDWQEVTITYISG